jgi:predicted outer membrane repeat protein
MSVFLLIGTYTAAGKVIYVDYDAQGPVYHGSSWDNAYKYLQNALRAASKGDEIRVAQGIYRPHEPVLLPPPSPSEPPVPPPPPDRTATFQLIDGVIVRGGYAGYGEPNPNARNIEGYETILSGDLFGNDVELGNLDWDTIERFVRREASLEENSYTVVTGSGTGRSAVLDGFTITAGHANNTSGPCDSPGTNGGGMYNYAGSPTVVNCTFHRNTICSEEGCSWLGACGAGVYNYNSNASFQNCKIIENIVFTGNVTAYGGGMCNVNSSPALTNCVFSRNMATGYDDEYYGGGMCNSGSNPTLMDCQFIANDAYYSRGGGMHNRENSSSTLINCVFLANTADEGAGVWQVESETALVNSVFSANFGTYRGGAILTGVDCNLALTNCTFSGNSASFGRGIFADFRSNTTIGNCILWDGGNEIDGALSSVMMSYSDVRGGWPGEGNINVDPCFVEPGYWDANDVWVEGDYHLLRDSACIDAGDNTAVPTTVTTDIDGKPRILNGIVDMGAYESQAVFFVDIDATGANDGSSWADAFNRIEDALEIALVGDEIRVAQGVYRPTPPSPEQASNPKPADGATGVSTTADLTWIAGSGAMSHDVYFGTASPGAFQGNQIGTTFDPGTLTLGTKYYWRIDEVSTWDTTIGEVWSFTTDPGPPPPLPSVESAGSTSEISITDHCRLATFELKNGVILKGGYAGFGEPDPDARDIEAYKTILSGDMNDDDVEVNDPCDLLFDPSRADNCYHVLTAIEIGYYGGPNTILDGFTITGGNANSRYPDWELGGGGGMYNKRSSPTVLNCTFTENSALGGGGGMNNEDSWPYLINCTFRRNFSSWGGGLANDDSRPTLIDCAFINNVSSYKGGAMACYDGSPPMNNCTFIDNRAVLGGAIYGADCRPKPTNCTFTGNTAEKGGVVYNNDSSVRLTNCTLSGNSATEGGVIYDDDGGSNLINCTLTANTAITGGAMYSRDDSYVRLSNCILSGNSAVSGGVIYSSNDSFVRMTNCTLWANSADVGNAVACDSYQQQYPSSIEMTNCILWDGGSEIWNNDGSIITVTYSDVQGGWLGEGNIDVEPLFVEPGYLDADGVWVEGDYRLRAGSLCIDAGTDAEVYTDIEDNFRPFDFPGADNNGGLPEFDMGAYEVIAKPEGELHILPRTISRQDRRILAVLRLSEPISGDDIDMYEPLVMYPGTIEAAEQNMQYKPSQSEVKIHAVFDKAELLSAAPGNGDIEVTVIGRFISGQYFYCTDQVRIINTQR